MNAQLLTAPWHYVCELDDIVPNSGVAALILDRQVAVFRIDPEEEVFAIDNLDPNSDASVLSRGIVGDLGGHIVVASPIYKQHYCLRTGQCLENPDTPVRTYDVQIDNGKVWLKL